MKKLLVVLLLLTTNVMAHGTGRYCSNTYCMMCNRLHLKYGHDTTLLNLTYSKYIQAHRELHQPVTFDPTPHGVVDAMLEAVQPTENDTLYDLGCGDGRILIAAVKKYNCKALGIEKNPRIAAIARANIKKAGLDIQIVVGDARNYELSGATIVTMYLFPDLMEELEPNITHATRIVSYSHAIPNRRDRQILVKNKYPIYVWERGGFL
ncbi:hypothetical protein LCGC14_1368400 [marine sediment metagenome]|uniref:Methyltransferase domain-containing protein n=1 Tax=marine sediment metagenome TaxID=412755 RepID=A0A0F9ML75_9ZZZZ